MFKENQEVRVALKSETPNVVQVLCYYEGTLVCYGETFSCVEDYTGQKHIVETNRLSEVKKTININGFEVPEPLREAPEEGTRCFTCAIWHEDTFNVMIWTGGLYDVRCLKRGLLHLTKEAAILHAKALLSFTEK